MPGQRLLEKGHGAGGGLVGEEGGIRHAGGVVDGDREARPAGALAGAALSPVASSSWWPTSPSTTRCSKTWWDASGDEACRVELALRARRAIAVDTSLTGRRIIRVLEQLAPTRGLPQGIVCDNGPEFAGPTLDAWAHHRGLKLRFIAPGKPVQNAYVETLNGRFRDECLNEHCFISLADAQPTIERWRQDYNAVRPHSSLADRTPVAFAAHWRTAVFTSGATV